MESRGGNRFPVNRKAKSGACRCNDKTFGIELQPPLHAQVERSERHW